MTDKLTLDLVRRITALERRLDDLVRPEVPEAIGEWKFIAETVLSATASSVTLSSIPGTYRMLVLLMQSRTDYGAEFDFVGGRFNGDSGNNYDRFMKQRDGAGNATYVVARATSSMHVAHCEGANSRASVFTVSTTYILGYALTDREKWLFTVGSGRWGNRSADSDLYLTELKSSWRSTAAVTSITLFPRYGSNLVSGCRFALYGVL